MDASLWVVALLSLVLGGMIGAGIATRHFVSLERARRATIGAAAGIARVGLDALPVRSAADILNGTITVVLGGIPYGMKVLPRRASREWLAKLDERWAIVTNALEVAADDTPQILALLTGHTDYMLSMLRLYDVDNVLPDNEFIDQYATDGEILAATVEVWRAANPLAAIGAEAAAETMAGTSTGPLNSPLTNMGGELTSSTTT